MRAIVTVHHDQDADEFRRFANVMVKLYLILPRRVSLHISRLHLSEHGILTLWWKAKVPDAAIGAVTKAWEILCEFSAPVDHRSVKRGALLERVRKGLSTSGDASDIIPVTLVCACCYEDMVVVEVDVP